MILAIETATELCSTALVYNNQVLSACALNEKNIHSEQLMVLINEVLKKASVALQETSAVAVSIGPGSFTGLRIGLSAAKGLALALGCSIIAVPTLDGVAESFRMENNNSKKKFCALIDAKRDEAYYAFYSMTQNDFIRESAYSIKPKKEIVADANTIGAQTQQPQISAASIGRVAERRQKELEVSDFSPLEPLYLREFVTTTPKKKILH